MAPLYLELSDLDWRARIVLPEAVTDGGTMWRRAWVDGVDHFQGGSAVRALPPDPGRRHWLTIQGCRDGPTTP